MEGSLSGLGGDSARINFVTGSGKKVSRNALDRTGQEMDYKLLSANPRLHQS